MPKTHEECVLYLENIRWNGIPTCPYCSSTKATAYKKESRYRCNNCFTSYSVTVGTLFHKTHLDLRKWLSAILILRKLNPSISARKLAKELKINRATASLIIKRLQETTAEQADMIEEIVRTLE